MRRQASHSLWSIWPVTQAPEKRKEQERSGRRRRRHLSDSGDDIRVTSVSDGDNTDAEVATASSAELDVVALVVVDSDTGKVSVVLDLRTHEGRAVVGDEDELGAAVAEGLEGLLHAKDVLAGLDHKLQTGIEVVLSGSLLSLCSCGRCHL